MPHNLLKAANTGGPSTLNRDDYKFLSDTIRRRSGLDLGDGKEYLLVSRLEPLARSMGLRSVGDMVTQMRAGKLVGHDRLVAEALATHETLFFRDPDSFAFLRKWVGETLAPARRIGERLRVWSAACSSGQEAYSLLIMMDELATQQAIRGPVEIIATDFSASVVAKAREGIFTTFEVGRGLTAKQRDKYFSPISQDRWQVRHAYRTQIRFEERNLLDGFSAMGPFDLVLCRNVMIYFDLPTKADILQRITRVLAKDGALVLGAAESIHNVVDCYENFAPTKVSFLRRK